MLRVLEFGIDCLRAVTSGAITVVQTAKKTLTQVSNVGRGIQEAINDAAFPPEPPSPQWEGWDWSGLDQYE